MLLKLHFKTLFFDIQFSYPQSTSTFCIFKPPHLRHFRGFSMLIPSYSAFLRFSDFAWRATVMTACGNTTESSAAPTPANSSVVLGESTEQSEASVDNDSITELDFSNINGFGVSAEYGDPYAKGKNWDITDETAITEFRQLLNESLSYAVDKNTAKNGMLLKGTAQWKVSDGKEYSIIVRQTTADAYNVKINKCYYNVPEDLINKLSDIITEQKDS